MGPGFSASSVLVVLLSGLAIAQDSLSSSGQKPPAIKKVTTRNVYFLKDAIIDLPCSVEEKSSKPVYYWLKNGERLNITSRMTMESGVGSLVIPVGTEEDEGVYQCVAENRYGKSLSVKRNVQQARMGHFPKLDEPLEVSNLLGRSIKLICDPPESTPKAKIRWIIIPDDDSEYDDDEANEGFNFVQLNDRITNDWTGNLYITNLRNEDHRNGARYVCMAENWIIRSFNQGEDKVVKPFGKLSNDSVHLMWHSDTEVLGLLKKTARFKCIFSGNPQPTIRWQRVDGKPMDVNRMKQGANGFDFEITNVKYSDRGTYECVGSTSVYPESKKHRFTLKVESRPIWDKQPKDTEVGVEENAVFECKANGTPKPKIQWYINGNPLEDEPPNKRRSLKNGKLVFTNLSRSDSQVIQCNASNEHGFLWADFYLHVLAIPAQVRVKPQAKLKVAEDQTVTITCKAYGKPTPKVVWFKGDQELSSARHEIQASGDLVIKNVKPNDKGDYRCYVSNRFGKDNARGTLTVRAKTQIESKPLNQTLVYGNEATFTCGAVTDPLEELRYTWLRNGVAMETDDERIEKVDGTLIIKDVRSSDTASYTCLAANDLDNATATAKLEVVAPPDSPYNVSLEACYTRRAVIQWDWDKKLENFSPLQSFKVEYNTSFNPDEWHVGNRVPASARRAEITLSPWVEYNFRVTGVNKIGVGKPSTKYPTLCTTTTGVPDRHPRKVKTVEDKTNYLVVEWEPMPKVDHNAPGFVYNITVKEKGGKNVMNFIERNYDIGRKEILVNKIYKPYEIIVRAQNDIGSPIQKAKTVQGYSGEAAPKVVPANFELDPDKNVTATSAGFRWDPVDTSEEAMQGKFTGYNVRFWKANQQETTMHEVFIQHTPKRKGRKPRQTEKIRAEVRGLPSYSEIEADVVAVNGHFSSNGSNVVNFSTPEGVPSAVEYLEALYRGSTHFLLEWGEPKEPNGNITGYKVGYKTIRGFTIGQLEEGEVVARRRVFLGGLEPETLYRVYVWAMTKEGTGEEYYIDVKTADDTSELAQPLIEQVVSGLTSANVTWKLSKLSGVRVGAHYFAQYRPLGGGKWKRGPAEEKENFWQEIKGLNEGTTYEVRIVAEVGKNTEIGYKTTVSDLMTFTTTGVEAKRGEVFSAGWFIGMMVAIAILLLILIIVCIIKRNRGDKYHVQEKERLRGSNPDDAQDHFNDDENGVGQSNSFQNDPEKQPLEYDETDSMEDYGDVDPGKFNEDGSFIGQYGAQKSEPPNASAMSTLV